VSGECSFQSSVLGQRLLRLSELEAWILPLGVSFKKKRLDMDVQISHHLKPKLPKSNKLELDLQISEPVHNLKPKLLEPKANKLEPLIIKR